MLPDLPRPIGPVPFQRLSIYRTTPLHAAQRRFTECAAKKMAMVARTCGTPGCLLPDKHQGLCTGHDVSGSRKRTPKRTFEVEGCVVHKKVLEVPFVVTAVAVDEEDDNDTAYDTVVVCAAESDSGSNSAAESDSESNGVEDESDGVEDRSDYGVDDGSDYGVEDESSAGEEESKRKRCSKPKRCAKPKRCSHVAAREDRSRPKGLVEKPMASREVLQQAAEEGLTLQAAPGTRSGWKSVTPQGKTFLARGYELQHDAHGKRTYVRIDLGRFAQLVQTRSRPPRHSRQEGTEGVLKAARSLHFSTP